MATLLKSSILAGALLWLLGTLPSGAQPLSWQTSKSNAMTVALGQGKLVLLLAGRQTCTGCTYMRDTICETNAPPIKDLIQQHYVPWYCAVDFSDEYYAYTNGLGEAFILPLICCIDPAAPDEYLHRTTDVQEAQPFYSRLLAQVTNQMAQARISRCILSNGAANLTLTNLVWGCTNRIERSPDFTNWTPRGEVISFSRGTNWSEPLTNAGSRTFYRIAISR